MRIERKGNKMLSEKDMAFDRLRCGIVIQAIEDYKSLAKGDKRVKEEASYEEIEKFLSSDWCETLLLETNIKQADLIAYCRKYKYQTFRRRLKKIRDEYKTGGWKNRKVARNIRRLLTVGNVWLTTDEADVITHNLFFDIGIDLRMSIHGASLALLKEGL